jgi:flagellar biosynthetic protein FlhB
LNLSKLNPISGFGRLFSLRQVLDLIKSMIKIALVSMVAYGTLWPAMSSIDSFVGADVTDTLLELMHLMKRFLIAILVTLLALAVLDYLYQRWEFSRNQRMSKQELKDEFKQQEGDPMIKARLRKLRMERARKRMMKAVPTATVVVTNPTHYAVALKYDRTMPAPKVVAKGMDLIALRIRDIARENSVPVVENAPLARTLHAMVDIDRDIMPEHYKAVAEIISFVMKLRANAVGAARVGPPVGG